jgi:hypothetical protein
MKNWKLGLIREELVTITNSFEGGILLSHLLYWTNRGFNSKFNTEPIDENYEDTTTADIYVEEELGSLKHQNKKERCWVFKSSKKFKEELMLPYDEYKIRKELEKLCKLKLINRRKSKNIKLKEKNTYEYRVNLRNVIGSLLKIGYPIENYISVYGNIFKDEYISEIKTEEFIDEVSKLEIESDKDKNSTHNLENKVIRIANLND